VVFAQVSRLIISMTLTSGNWSRCVTWGSLKDKNVGMPSHPNRQVDIEIATMDYVPTTPLTLAQWAERTAAGYIGLGTVFERTDDPTQILCNRLCRMSQQCLLTHVTETGCFHAMYSGIKGENCFGDHSSSAANVPGSPLHKLAEQTQATGYMCKWNIFNDIPQCDGKNVSLTESGHFRFKNVTLENDHNPFAFLIGMSRQGIPRPLLVQKHRVDIHRGSPLPASTFLTMTEGVEFLKRPVQGKYEVRVGHINVADVFHGSLKLRLLCIFTLGDDDFEIVNPKNVHQWDGSSPEAWGRRSCRSRQSPHYRLWLCSDSTDNEPAPEKELQSSSIVEVDLFNLAASSVTIQVGPRETSEMKGIVDNTNLRIVFVPHRGTPMQWGLEDSCTLFGKGTFDRLTASINEEVILTGLEKCANRTIQVSFWFKEEGDEPAYLVNETMKYRSFLAMAMRKTPFVGQRIKYVVAAAKVNRAAVLDLLVPMITAQGLELNPAYIDDLDLSCKVHQELYSSVQLPWNELIYHAEANDIANIICGDRRSETILAPSFIAHLMGKGADEQGIIRIIKCVDLPSGKYTEFLSTIGPARRSELDWNSETSSPVVAAVKHGYPKALAALLELYPEVVGHRVELLEEDRWRRFSLQRTLTTETLLGPIEFSFLFKCSECIDSVATAISKVSFHCEVGTEEEGRWQAPACKRFFERMGRLSLDRAGIGQPKMLAEFRKALETLAAKGVAITVLEFSGNGLTNDGLLSLSDSFRQLTKLRSLDLSYNLLDFCTGSDEAKALLSLQALKSLETIQIQGNNLCRNGHSGLVKVYASLPNLKTLDISRTRLGDCDPELVQSAAKNLVAIRQLNVSSNKLGSELLSQLLKEKSLNSDLESLSIMDVNLPFQEAEGVGKMIAHLKNLVYLELGSNCLRDKGVAGLGFAFSNMKKLRYLDLRDVCMTGMGLSDMAQASGQLTLETLVLKNNELGMGTIEVIATHFAAPVPPSPALSADPPEGTFLKTLDLGNTTLQQDLPALAAKFGKEQPFHYLTSLNLDDPNGFFGANLTELFKSIGTAKHLESLSIARTTPGERESLDGLLELSKLWTLHSLDLSGHSLAGPLLNEVFGERSELPMLNTFIMRNCTFPPPFSFTWLRHIAGLTVLDLSWSNLSREDVRSIFDSVLHDKGDVKELSLAGVEFHSEDLPAIGVGTQHWLSYFVGDFSDCDLNKLGKMLPRAALHSTIM